MNDESIAIHNYGGKISPILNRNHSYLQIVMITLYFPSTFITD